MAAAVAFAAGCSGGGGAASDAGAPDGAALDAPTSGTPGVLRDYLGTSAFPDDFWQPATGAGSGVDQPTLEQAAAHIAASGWEIHAFVVAHNGRLVFERYGWNTGANPVDPNKTPRQVVPSERHLTFSSTKSFLSVLLGIALDDGSIAELDVKAAASFPDYAALNPSPDKASITLADLLTMRSGLQFTEGEQSTFAAPDPARAMFARPVVDLPVGTVWNYSSGASDVIAEMLRVATDQTPLAYAKTKLFGPIGIVDPPWLAGASGTNYGGFGLDLTAREMARFGELVRNRGAWNGTQVVPAAWIDTATAAQCASTWGMQYGYHFWVFNVPGFVGTIGAFGQQIFVNRDLGLVVVFTANLPSEQANTIFEGIIRDYVVPAVR